MPRGAFSIARPRRGRFVRKTLAASLTVVLGALSAGCASALEDPADLPTAARTAASAPAPAEATADSLPRRPVRRVAARPGSAPRGACLAAVRQAERAHRIPEGLMVAVALAESGLHAYAMSIGGRPHFPTTAEEARRLYAAVPAGSSLMAGCVQVNARAHARNSDWPLDPVRAADWGAAYLRRMYERGGGRDWADAVKRWNGGGASGDRLACRVRGTLAVTNPRSDAMAAARCGAGAVAREHRNGRALLEIAEAAEP